MKPPMGYIRDQATSTQHAFHQKEWPEQQEKNSQCEDKHQINSTTAHMNKKHTTIIKFQIQSWARLHRDGG